MENQNSNRLDDKTDLQVLRTSRSFAPSDFIFKIQSFSSLLSCTTKKVESRIFEAGGYKWRVRLSSRGSKSDNISLYLSVAETDKLPSGWEILVNYKFFLFNQIKNEYLCVQDLDGKVRRFHCLKREWGFDELLAMSTFSDSTNGYLVDDCCAFGVEIFVIKPSNATFEFLDLSKTLESPIFSWKIKDYSKSQTEKKLYSPEFIIGGWEWELKFYPNGNGKHVGKSVSFFLRFIDVESLGGDSELDTKYKLQIRDQVCGGSKEREGIISFRGSKEPKTSANSCSRGWHDFLSLKELKDAANNYLLDDTLVLEVEICGLSKVKEIKISDVPMDSA